MFKQNDFKDFKDKKLLVIVPSFANEDNIFIKENRLKDNRFSSRFVP